MIHAVGWALLHLLWQGIVVAGILGAALALMTNRSANARYLVSCGALVSLVLLAIATAMYAYEPARNIVLIAPLDSSLNLERTLPSVVLAWITGVVLLSSRLLLMFLKAHRLARSGAQAMNEEWLLMIERLSQAMDLSRAVRLLESTSVDVPSVIGWLRPVILVPATALTGLSTRQIEMVLAHELAHIRRHDFFVNLLQSVVETLMFYQPAVWWMSHRIRVERENCCDDLAVSVCGDAIQYARALARLEELRSPQLAVAATGGTVLDRIRRIAGLKSDSTSSRWTAALATLAIIIMIVTIPSVPAQAQREETKAPGAKKAAAVVEVTPEAISDGIEGALADDDDDTPEPPPAPPAPRTPRAPRAHVAPALAAVPAPPAPPAPPTPAIAPAPRALPTPRPTPAIAPLAPLPAMPRLQVNVTQSYVRAMQDRFENLTLDGVASLAESGVTTQWLDEMADAGVEIRNAHAAAALRDSGVTAELIRESEEK